MGDGEKMIDNETEEVTGAGASANTVEELVSGELILREVGFALSPDRPVGFFAVVMSYSEPLGRVVPTIIDIRGECEATATTQLLIHDKLVEIGELLRNDC
jgi:hypothetical protein